jgi:hypothetical protein
LVVEYFSTGFARKLCILIELFFLLSFLSLLLQRRRDRKGKRFMCCGKFTVGVYTQRKAEFLDGFSI